jgi:hypothetical protein
MRSAVFFDKVLFAHETIKPQYWDGQVDASGEERTFDIPGILGEASFDGVAVFYNHVMLWKGTRLIWSDVADFTLWFPASATITSLNLTTLNDFTQAGAGGVVSEDIYVNPAPIGLVEGAPLRFVDPPTNSYWTVDEVSPFSGQDYEQENLDAASPEQTISRQAPSNKRKIYIAQDEILPALADSIVHPISDVDGDLHFKITDQSPNVSYIFYTNNGGAGTLDLTTAAWPVNTVQSVGMSQDDLKLMEVGDIVSIDIQVSTGRELFTVNFIDHGNSAVDLRRGAFDPVLNTYKITGRTPWNSIIGNGTDSIIVTLQRWIELENQLTDVTVLAVGAFLIGDTTIDVDDGGGGSVFADLEDGQILFNSNTDEYIEVDGTPTSDSINVLRGRLGSAAVAITDNDPLVLVDVAPKGVTLEEQYFLKLKTVGSTGQVAESDTVPDGTLLLTVDANESGEILNVDPEVAGEIYNWVQIGELAYILKERSIQSVQYVGLSQGVFFIRPEVTEDGMVGRNAFVKLNDDSIAMLGNRDLYIYRGGRDLVPIAREYTIELFKELNYDARNEISLHHDEIAREIWVVYPAVVGNLTKKKVFIYNYEDRSCTLDDYSSNEVALTAMSYAKPFELVTWNDLVGDWTAQMLAWRDYDTVGVDRRLLIGAFQADNAGGKIPNGCDSLERETDLYFLATSNLTRFGTSYIAEFETADIDWGAGRSFKYLDEIFFTFDFEEFVPADRPLVMMVAAGTRDQSDAEFRWTPFHRVEVSGAGQVITKCNIRLGGRYIRLRVKSSDADVFWQIAQIELFARMGGYS